MSSVRDAFFRCRGSLCLQELRPSVYSYLSGSFVSYNLAIIPAYVGPVIVTADALDYKLATIFEEMLTVIKTNPGTFPPDRDYDVAILGALQMLAPSLLLNSSGIGTGRRYISVGILGDGSVMAHCMMS